MKNVEMRCMSCGQIYPQEGHTFCPKCKGCVADKVLCYVNERMPVVSFNGLLDRYPNVLGLNITSDN